MPGAIVIALGGNAITRSGEAGTIPQQFAHTAETLEQLKPLLAGGRALVITHGSGPQIGNVLIRVEEGGRRVPTLPLDTCDADVQGGMGYMIQRLACELFRREGIHRDVVTLVTQVLVDRHDPGFAAPSKYIGSFYDAERAAELRVTEPAWLLREVSPGRFRRVVPSPRPLEVLEARAISCLIEAGVVVIACGGGGIPVAWDGGRLVGVEGVIDKDPASSLLATRIGAASLLILTSVPQVAVRFGQPEQRWLDRLSAAEARALLAGGEFPPGSMGPKIEAAAGFVERGGGECIITSPECAGAALAGQGGTRITL